MKEILKKLTDIFFPNGTVITVNNTPIRFLYRWKNYFLDRYEEENFEFFRANVKKSNPVIIDLGAHLGLFSLLMAKHLSGKCSIYAFEAAPQTFRFLAGHIRINQLTSSITPVNKAASDANGEIVFYVSDNKADNANSISSYKGGKRKFSPLKVESVSIDSFLTQKDIRSLDFMKIDVEGAECRVINGAKASISKYKPVMLLSVHPSAIRGLNDDLEEAFRFLQQSGYQIFLNRKKIEHYQQISGIEELYDLHLIP